MKQSEAANADLLPQNGAGQRDRLEVIRFPSADARQQAIGGLLEYGMLNFTSYSDDEWLVRTPVARKLREIGVSFKWLTENT